MVDNRSQAGDVPEPTGIVSVNSRGGKSTAIAAKFAVVLLFLGVSAVGALYTYNNLKTSRKSELQAPSLDQPNDKESPAIGRRRVFDTETMPTASASLPAATVCADGTRPQFQMAPDGQPLLTPAGLPKLACPTANAIVPALEPMPLAFGPQTTQAPGKSSSEFSVEQKSSPTPSRYAGDVILAQTDTRNANDSAGNATPSLQQSASLDASPRPERPSGVIGPHGGRMLAAATATMIGDRDMILPKGRTIDCALTVRLVSEYAGQATCVLSAHAYSDSGRVVLAERGSVVTGEYAAAMSQGQRRLMVVWTRLQTPKGVIIDINAPSSDALGGAGLPGHVDNHWSERIGAAVLLSLVEDAIGYATAKAASENGGGAAQGIAVFQNSTRTGQSLAERILDSTINIKPTLYKNQGDRATIFVNQDLDFGGVYALRAE